MVKAGSSEKGVCPACFAPWVRVTERTKYKPEVVAEGVRNVDASRGDKVRKLDGKSKEWRESAASARTLGWQQSCKCPPADPVPSLVLDPFAGSGTTLAVAVKLKRRALGIELNPEYAALAEKRLAEPLGTGGLYDTGVPVVATLFDGLEPEAP